MTTATVSPRTKSTQKNSTRKSASSTTPQAKESPQSAAADIIDIIEWVDFIEPETPLAPEDAAKLYDVASNYARLALAISNHASGWDARYSAAQLALLQACVQASKTGKLNLPKREMKRCAGVFAVKLFKELSMWGENAIEEGAVTLALARR
jgi:hypothetical protein